jgi:DNA-binding MarR family transcriptional regulator
VRSGYVERRDDPADRRRVLLSLTRTGLRLVTDLREGSHSLLRRWMSSLSPEDLAALTRGWRALADVASRHGQVVEHSAV